MSKLNVLVVDDEVGLRLGVERTLRGYKTLLEEYSKKFSFSVTTVDCGQDALNHIEESDVDILILDHKLPDIQGLDILAKLKKEKNPILTIMITAFASLEVAISATRNGAFDFLAKPFTPDELRGRVDKASKHLYLKRKAAQFEQEKKQIRFEFIRVLAHELKSPLAAVEGYLNMMKGGFGGDSIKNYENMIDRSMVRADGMRKLINDLLDLTRIESGNKKRELVSLDLVDLCKNAFEGVALEAKGRGIELKLEGAASLMVEGDPSEIEIIFNNLVTNAVKYNKDNGDVVVTLSESGGLAQIQCADSGIGMSPEDQKKLFGEFTRIKNSKTKGILGSGLGLSILKKIVDLYSGSIEVTSKEDEGTTFIVSLKQ